MHPLQSCAIILIGGKQSNLSVFSLPIFMKNTGALWGGRFTEAVNEVFAEFNRSFEFDRRLFSADIQGSIAHVNALNSAGILTREEADLIIGRLRELLAEGTTEAFFSDSAAEDVHSFIESKLVEKLGDLGKKVHTGRSRNDQVATAFRLWLREEIDQLIINIRQLRKALTEAASRHINAVLPGYTHLQRAQPVLWAHWCLAYFEMLQRDADRLSEVRRRVNVLPLGSAALAGSGLPIDREGVAAELGFEKVSGNSLDAVSDRDFAIEFAGACSLIMLHLSRLAEDLILYCSAEFGFVRLGDSVSTGSSLMPQKKNPDALELIRGKAGRVFGRQLGLLATMKGLPLAYNKDMQEDKEAVFDCLDTTRRCTEVARIVLDNLELDEQRALDAATHGYLNATDLADYLVRKGMPFRTAHDAVGRLVLLGLETNRELGELDPAEMQAIVPEIGEDVFAALDLENSLAAKDVIGGTARQRVLAALKEAKELLESEGK